MLKSGHELRARVLSDMKPKKKTTCRDVLDYLGLFGTAYIIETDVIPNLTKDMVRIAAKIEAHQEQASEYRSGLKYRLMELGLHPETAKHMHSLPMMAFITAAHQYLNTLTLTPSSLSTSDGR
jgi:hypothetical protein